MVNFAVLAALNAVLLPITLTVGVVPDTPHFLVTLPDKELLCYGFKGIPLFTFNLLSTKMTSVNSYVNISDANQPALSQNIIGIKLVNDDPKALRGVNIVSIVVEGDTVYVNDMGGIDIKGKLLLLGMKNNDMEFEVASSPYTEVKVKLQDPPAMARIIRATDGSFNVLMEDVHVKDDPIHGIMGQFLQKGVHLDKENKLLVVPSRGSVPVYQTRVWPELQIAGYKDKSCWRPEVGHMVTEGENYDYITDHVTGTKFKFSLSMLQK